MDKNKYLELAVKCSSEMWNLFKKYLRLEILSDEYYNAMTDEYCACYRKYTGTIIDDYAFGMMDFYLKELARLRE